MSDESTQTNISSLDEEPLPTRQHPLPWILFGVAAVLLALVGALLARRVNVETRRANEAVEANAGLKAQLAQLLKQQGEVDEKIAAADKKAKEAQDASIETATRLKAIETERDKLTKELEAAKKVASAESGKKDAKKPEPPPKKGKKPVKKKKRK